MVEEEERRQKKREKEQKKVATDNFNSSKWLPSSFFLLHTCTITHTTHTPTHPKHTYTPYKHRQIFFRPQRNGRGNLKTSQQSTGITNFHHYPATHHSSSSASLLPQPR
jgi:hypothetical protein